MASPRARRWPWSARSGCGKSVSALAILGPRAGPGGPRRGGSVRFAGRDLLTLGEDQIRAVRGRQIAMIFQEPMTSLNPVLTIGTQLTEGMRRHLGIGRQEAVRARRAAAPGRHRRARAPPAGSIRITSAAACASG